MRLPLLNLILLFLLPVFMALYLLLSEQYKNMPTGQHGTFIKQATKLNIKYPEYLAGQSIKHKWSLVYIQPQLCTLACQQQKKILLNLHTALGAERNRVAILATTNTLLDIDIAENSFLIINPQGFYIMHYDAAVNHSGILKDLRRLLKYSHGE